MLGSVLRSLPRPSDPRLLVGIETGDDAGIFQLTPELALVQTVDFFTPIVDDPYWFGRIAAANALSDVYAMGGTPLTGMNIVCFPDKTLPLSMLEEILRGGSDAALEAGVTLLGGHSVRDAELKFGMSITGIVHPAELVTNAGARVGDVLVLTKPLGTGVLSTALKRGKLPEGLLEPLTRQMAALNAPALRAMKRLRVRGATDITGFGLAGHALGMARASGVSFEITAESLPLLSEARALAQAGMVPGGGKANREAYALRMSFAEDVDEALRILICDPQTSGGMLMAVPQETASALDTVLQEEGLEQSRVIGRVVPPSAVELKVS